MHDQLDDLLIIKAGRIEKNYWKDLWRYRELLSGITSPSYMLTLVKMKLKWLTVSHDPVFQKYISSVRPCSTGCVGVTLTARGEKE